MADATGELDSEINLRPEKRTSINDLTTPVRFRNTCTPIFLPAHPHISFSTPVILGQAIVSLYDLNVGIMPLEEGAPHQKPHKPMLLLAAFDLITESSPPTA